MFASAEFLWRINQEYVNRLARARNYLDLLEQLVLERGGDELSHRFLPTLRFTRMNLASLSEEHRDWCYTYFYETPDSKRMVHAPSAVRRALSNFRLMRERQAHAFHDVAALLVKLPRPAPSITRVPNGDLWDMLQRALRDLVDFASDEELQPASILR
ncbi:MAG: hypothetical protein IT319_04935 [Anaerolineae bacterium]|nr:hypothetical protein [Anaerolineae bacterium]